MMTTKIYSHLL